MNIVSIQHLRYEKYAKAAGMIDLRQDTLYITKLNKHNNLRKEYVKAYIKLLSK